MNIYTLPNEPGLGIADKATVLKNGKPELADQRGPLRAGRNLGVRLSRASHFLFLLLLTSWICRASAQTNAAGYYLPPTNPPSVVLLSWVPISSTNVTVAPATNFIIYQGTNSLQYNQVFSVGNVTNYAVSNLTRGLTYYWNLASQGGGLTTGWQGEIHLAVLQPPAGATWGPVTTLVAQYSPTISPANWTNIATLPMPQTGPTGFYRLLAQQVVPSVITPAQSFALPAGPPPLP